MKPRMTRSSSSSEGEDTNNYREISQLQGVPCKNERCDQELVCVNNTDHYCSRICYYSKLERDKIGETGIQLKRVTIKGRGGTGLLRDRSVLDHLQIKVDNRTGRRVVTVNNSGTHASKWKRRAGKGKEDTATNKEEVVDEAKRKQNEEEKQRLKALLNFDSSEDSTSDDEDGNDDNQEFTTKVVEEADEEICTLLSSGINASICPIHPPMMGKGKSVKGYIINIVSPWELYVQTEEMVLKTHELDLICNRPEGIDPRLVLPLWLPKLGEYCTAKYQGKLYRGKILEKMDEGSSKFRVKYVDYGNIGDVPYEDVFQLNPEITLIPRQYFFFKISNAKPLNGGKKWSSEVCQFLVEHLDGGIVQLEIESVERGVIHWGKLSVSSSLSGEIQGDLGNTLVQRELADSNSFFV